MESYHLIQYAIYSRLMSELNLEKLSIYWIIIFCILYYLSDKYILYQWIDKYIYSLFNFLNKLDECSITIPYHTKTYCYGSNKQTKTIYSERFLAINHYIKTNVKNLTSLIELMNFDNTSCSYDISSDFILLPLHHEKLLICTKNEIYLEMIIEKIQDEEAKENTQKIVKKYNYKLSKRNIDSMAILTDFLEKCVASYLESLKGKGGQMIYEYEFSKKDEDQKLSLVFREMPFKSNKTFANIFFENKDVILNDIREFSKGIDPDKKEKIIARYKYLGIPYKRIYLLYGPPGSGKSSLVKAFVNETGRHCILVQWSKIKTSADFSNLCSDIKVQYKDVLQKDVILVFEDFDANQSTVVKSRFSKEQIKQIQETPKEQINTFLNLNIFESNDELTLECVLNTLDGIKELYDTVIVFTTNVLDSIDPALIRPGRVDKIIHMDYISVPIIKQMLEYYYQTSVSLDENSKIPLSSPAKIQEICMRNSHWEKCVSELHRPNETKM